MPGSRDVDESKRTTLRRFAALGAATPLAGMASGSEGESDDSEARSAIAGYLSTTPGAHFSKIRDDLQLGTGETQHHLRELVDAGRVETRRDGDYRRYFPADRFSAFEQVVLGYLRRDTPRGMLVALLRDPSATGGDIADKIGVSSPTVSKYAGELESAGLLSREDGYAVREPETVLTLIVRYADSFGEDAEALAGEADELIRFDP
ncbi:Predicted transcriptional regulator, containsd two HTH domains [Natronoarchaeum philippinense]|uniref:Predicted transcriptional regulator, containsd two HTH domains n=1 Tax=Natronoarchaeum philippinense TaxID=558529 RepID=A0A285NZF2_NATPI|nr:winged helix-turn-helix transcriptional regulator [Natronoarchaeum philippinense]SNZ13286.1 Predicted transcriptional regulator, containsd two HTH domains [Natronoarchaeum philippinense]